MYGFSTKRGKGKDEVQSIQWILAVDTQTWIYLFWMHLEKPSGSRYFFFFFRPRSPCFLRSIDHLFLDRLWWWTWSELWPIFIRTAPFVSFMILLTTLSFYKQPLSFSLFTTAPFVSNDLVVSSIPLLERVDCWLMHCVLWCLWGSIEMVWMHQPH